MIDYLSLQSFAFGHPVHFLYFGFQLVFCFSTSDVYSTSRLFCISASHIYSVPLLHVFILYPCFTCLFCTPASRVYSVPMLHVFILYPCFTCLFCTPASHIYSVSLFQMLYLLRHSAPSAARLFWLRCRLLYEHH